MYGNASAKMNWCWFGAHLNLYGGTFDVLSGFNMGAGTPDPIPDNLMRIDIWAGTLILPNNFSANVQDWIDRGILLAYGKTPNIQGNPKIIVNVLVNPNRTTVTASQAYPPEASEPIPPDGATNVYRKTSLTWAAGKDANRFPEEDGHEVYFDTNEAKVEARSGCAVNGVFTTDGLPKYELYPPALGSLTTYYWAIDEVNDVCDASPWLGNVWKFTTADKTVIDAFERYTKTGFALSDFGSMAYPLPGELRRTWIDGEWSVMFPIPPAFPNCVATSGSYVQLNTDPCDGTPPTIGGPIGSNADIALSPIKSMKFYYDNDGAITWLNDLYHKGTAYNYTAPMYSEASAAVDDAARLSAPNPPFNIAKQESLDLEIGRNWSGYKLLRVPYYGDPANTVVSTDKLYVGLKDGDGTLVVVSNSDQTVIQQAGWHYWYIRLKDFNTPPTGTSDLDLTNVARIYIGIGNRTTQPTGGRGAVFFDDIQLITNGICVPGTLTGDFTGDCKVNSADLQRMNEVWLGSSLPTPPTPVINLDASALNLGTLSTWNNTGTAGGSFGDFNTKVPVPGYRPTVAIVEGVRAVVFDGNDVMMATFRAPASITGAHAFTAIYKVWNLNIGIEEWVIMWSKRGGPDGTYAGVGYGTSPDFGVAAQWGVPDMGFDRGVPAAHTWHTIAVTYPGGPNTVETVLVDGVVNAIEGPKTLNIFADCNVTVGAAYDGNSNDPNVKIARALTPILNLSGAVANVKIYDVAISPGNLAILMDAPMDMNNDNVIDFKDIALFANNWLKTLLWP
jgi:hypothetical protein